MRLGRVVGKVISTVKDPQIKGNVIRLVEIINEKGVSKSKIEIAADTVGAKNGDWVITVKSSSARMTKMTHNKPIDNSIVAIVDIINFEGKEIYSVK